MRRKLTHGLDTKLRQAIEKGLDRGDANMVKVVNDLITREDTTDILKSVNINITEFTIPDTSLRDIILQAPEPIIAEVLDALRERKRRMEFGSTIESDVEGRG